MTVSEILRLALPPGSSVLAGHSSLGRAIFWARLLGPRQSALGPREAGELVLLPIGASQGRGFGRLLHDLAEAGVEAVVVGDTPASGEVAVADELAIPVLHIAEGTSLAEAERSIVSLIVDREAQLRHRVEQIYERLLTTLVDDAGIGPLAAEVGQVTARPTIVLDEYFRVQVTHPADSATQALGDALGVTLAAHDPQPPSDRAAPFLVHFGPADAAVLVAALRLRGTPAGYLVLGGDDQFSDLDRRVLDRAARVIGIELAKQRAVTEAELRLQGDFLDDLFSGSYPSEEAMLARARWMGHDLAGPHVVLALAVDEIPQPGDAAGSHRMRASDLVRTELLRLAPGALLREQQGTLDVAVPRGTVPSRVEAIDLAERLRRPLNSRFDGAHVTIGVGRYHPTLAGLARAHREADQALQIGRALLGGAQTVHFEDLGVQRLLFQLRDNPELASFQEDVLGRLHAHDERQGADLVNTLEAFFACHGNHVRTARRLHLHRNTLLYRLERARQVLGLDFDDAETRLAMQVALQIRRVIRRSSLDAPPGSRA